MLDYKIALLSLETEHQIQTEYYEICNRTVKYKTDLIDIAMGEVYSVSFKKIGDSVLLTELKGSFENIDFPLFIAFRDRAIVEYFEPGSIYFEICDFKLICGLPSRNFLLSFKERLIRQESNKIIGYFLVNLDKQLHVVVNAGLGLNRESDIYFDICDSFNEAFAKIDDLISNRSILHKKPEQHSQILNQDLEKIKNLLGSIIWRNNEPDSFSSDNEQVEEIFSLVRYIKKDYYETVDDLVLANEESKRNNQRIDRINNILQSIFDNMNLAIALVSMDTKTITHVNSLMEKLLELPKEKIVGKTCKNLFCYSPTADCENCLNWDSAIQNKEIKILKTQVLAHAKRVGLEETDYIMFSFFDNTYSKEIERKNRNYQNNLILLSNCATDLLSINNSNSIFKYIGRGINEFINNSVILVCKFNSGSSDFTLTDIFQDGKISVIIIDPEYLKRSFALYDEVFYYWLNERFKNITDEKEYLPDIVSEIQSKVDFLKNIYVSSLRFDKHLYGLVFVLTNKSKLDNIEIISSFVNQASMTLYKKDLEEKILEEKIQAQHSLKNREILLKEVHHRVKNNMAVISSLLKLQQNRIHDPILDKAFNDSRNRIKSMALVHEKLYEGDDLEHIDFADYIKFLGKHLINSYKLIYVDFSIEAPQTFVDLDTSISLGLIINEIITNSLKYAFKEFETDENKEARIFVKISHEFNLIKIIIGDNGGGISPEYNIGKTHSLGLELIQSLSQQIDAIVSLSRDNGTVYTILIPNQLNNNSL